MVLPFRVKVYKTKKRKYRQRRVPKEPIGEKKVDERSYGDANRRRNDVGVGKWVKKSMSGNVLESTYDFTSVPSSSQSYNFIFDQTGVRCYLVVIQ